MASAKRSQRTSQPVEMRTDRYIGMGPAEVDGNDGWRLICACVDGDADTVAALIADDPNLANVQYWYQTPLHFAVRENHVHVAKALRLTDPTTSAYGGSAWADLLAVAERRGSREMAEFLRSEMTQRFAYSEEFGAVVAAMREYDQTRVLRILEDEPGLRNASDGCGNTVMHWAALTHQTDLIRELAEAGADPDARRADGKTPVLLAFHGDYDFRWWRDVPPDRRVEPTNIVSCLLEVGAERPFGLAVFDGDSAEVRNRLGAQPGLASTLDAARRSALCYASTGGQVDMTTLLLSHRAQPNCPESEAPCGRALYEASARNHLEQARVLLRAGANPNAHADSSGNCLYINAQRHPQACDEIQALLRTHGAEPASWQLSSDELREALAAGRSFEDEDSLWTDVLEKQDPAHLIKAHGARI